MKIHLTTFFLLACLIATAQETETNQWFITSNSGVLRTPLGIKFGRIGKVGWNLGIRFGKGDMRYFNEDVPSLELDDPIDPAFSDYESWWAEKEYQENEVTNFSFTIGINYNVLQNDKFSMHLQGAAGYARWWDEYANRWYNLDGGAELEAGLLLKYNNWIANVTGNYLFKDQKIYPAGDFCLGLGYCF